jgi:small-conductance mechanosensitive channel
VLGPVLAAIDPEVAACGVKGRQSWLCSTVYRITGDEDLAEVADTLSVPIRIAFVFVLALVAVRLARRLIHRAARLATQGGRDGLGLRGAALLLSDTERRRRGQRIETLSAVLANVVSLVIWAIAAFVIIGLLGIDLAPLLAGAGVITVVIGFGAQTVVRDFLAGLFMVLEDQYGVGDVISIDADTTGRVEWISLRVTRLRDDDGIVWWVPNGEIKKLGNRSHLPGDDERPAPEDGDDAAAQ